MMRTTKTKTALLTLSLAAGVIGCGDGKDGAAATVEVDYTEDREPCRDRNPLRNLYFGDLHSHSRFSWDTYLAGTLGYPTDAYRSARDRGLDFAAVTDHSEFLGETRICMDPDSAAYETASCQSMRGEIPSAAVIPEHSIVDPYPERPEEVCGEDDSYCYEALEARWAEIVDMADLAYDKTAACSFTAFAGYEYTKSTYAWTVHRNVVFRNANVPARPTSYYEATTLPEFWRALSDDCLEAGIGCDVIAIPHNSNESDGHDFRLAFPEGSTLEEQRELSALIERLEPVVEVYQHKGSSECFSAFTSDEDCDFENLNLELCGGDGSEAGFHCAAKSDYVREALAIGLGEWRRLGVNPIRLGMVASTDTHNATPGKTDEGTFNGHGGTNDGDAVDRLMHHSEFSPAGLTGVWAYENSRDALFDALQRRETFGTSGTRISVRLFGAWSWPNGLCDDDDESFLTAAYRDGVPMGATLPPPAKAGGAPVFAIKAQKDETLLKRVQIVKVWIDAEGNSKERVFDVAGDFSGSATVDTATCEPQGEGFETLCGTWSDTDFDASLPAAYYARVLENPTCRWSTYACNALPAVYRPTICDSPQIIEERAWSSPIWYEPKVSNAS